MAKSVGAMLLGPGQSTERLCSHFINKETQHRRLTQEDGGDSREKTATSGKDATETAAGIDPVVPWSVERLYIVDTLRVMCRISNEAIQTVVANGTVSCLLGMLRWVVRLWSLVCLDVLLLELERRGEVTGKWQIPQLHASNNVHHSCRKRSLPQYR